MGPGGPSRPCCRQKKNFFHCGGLQNGISFLFFILGPVEFGKSMSDKSFHYICFSKFFGVCLFPILFISLFFKRVGLFCLKLRILVGNMQLKKFSKKIKSLTVLDFSSTGCTKCVRFERIMIVQTHAYDGKNGGFFFFFFQKKQ